MQKIQWLIFTTVAVFLTACSSAKKTSTNNKKAGDFSFRKLFVVVPSPDIQERVRLENELSASLLAAGYMAVKSLDVIPFSLDTPKLPSKADFDIKAKENECDAVLLLSLARKGETVTVVKGTSINANQQIGAGFLSGILNNSGSVQAVAGVQTPTTFANEKSSFSLQCILYELATQIIFYTSQSPNFDISSSEKAKKEYVTSLIRQLEKENLLKR